MIKSGKIAVHVALSGLAFWVGATAADKEICSQVLEPCAEISGNHDPIGEATSKISKVRRRAKAFSHKLLVHLLKNKHAPMGDVDQQDTQPAQPGSKDYLPFSSKHSHQKPQLASRSHDFKSPLAPASDYPRFPSKKHTLLISPHRGPPVS